MNKPNGTGLMRIVRAGQCSVQGFRSVYRNEAAFRQELLGFVLLAPIAFLLADTVLGICLMLFGLGLVLLIEVVNSAIEAVVDRVGPEQHELSGLAKDLGSLAVAMAIALCALIWLGVYLSGF